MDSNNQDLSAAANAGCCRFDISGKIESFDFLLVRECQRARDKVQNTRATVLQATHMEKESVEKRNPIAFRYKKDRKG